MATGKQLSIFNFLRMSSRITTSGMPLKEEIPEIAGLGVESVITLVPEGVGSDLPGEAELVDAAGMRFSRIPVYWESPEIDDFTDFCRIMATNQHQKCHVHCEANMRVSVFMALYRIIVREWTKSAAMTAVAEIWKPNETWQAYIRTILANGAPIHAYLADHTPKKQ
ncbi:MAG: phosphatase [Desulfobacteraceae bacterium]|nr:phosphatase [Desulfobacteraceae bacterium]